MKAMRKALAQAADFRTFLVFFQQHKAKSWQGAAIGVQAVFRGWVGRRATQVLRSRRAAAAYVLFAVTLNTSSEVTKLTPRSRLTGSAGPPARRSNCALLHNHAVQCERT